MRIAIVLAVAGACVSAASAEPFKVKDVPQALDLKPDQLQPNVAAFSDHANSSDAVHAGLPHYIDWAKDHAQERPFLSLFPTYGDANGAPTGSAVPKSADAPSQPPAPDAGKGGKGAAANKLSTDPYMYVAEARFLLHWPAASIDLTQFTSVAFMEKIDPSIKHRLISSADTKGVDAANRDPQRAWCTGGVNVTCFASHYEFEGQLPMGIKLANKLAESSKKVDPFLDFQSELRIPTADDIATRNFAQLTGIGTPVAGVVEESIFHVNQVISFGKFVAVLQPHPADANQTVVTVLIALAIKPSVFDRKREYANIPILRNLVPAAVLLGKSSFNTGTSISAGLPAYSRNRIALVADSLERK